MGQILLSQGQKSAKKCTCEKIIVHKRRIPKTWDSPFAVSQISQVDQFGVRQ